MPRGQMALHRAGIMQQTLAGMHVILLAHVIVVGVSRTARGSSVWWWHSGPHSALLQNTRRTRARTQVSSPPCHVQLPAGSEWV